VVFLMLRLTKADALWGRPLIRDSILCPPDGALSEPLSDHISAQPISLMNLISNHSWYLPPFLRTSTILANFHHSCELPPFLRTCTILANFHHSYEHNYTSNPSITLIHVATLNYGSWRHHIMEHGSEPRPTTSPHSPSRL